MIEHYAKEINHHMHAEIAIVGGGLGGLISAIKLAEAGFSVKLFEKKEYPFHKVCGESILIYTELLPLPNSEYLLLPEKTFTVI